MGSQEPRKSGRAHSGGAIEIDLKDEEEVQGEEVAAGGGEWAAKGKGRGVVKCRECWDRCLGGGQAEAPAKKSSEGRGVPGVSQQACVAASEPP